jgi:HJR/Mrr/RecB family endonuclease
MSTRRFAFDPPRWNIPDQMPIRTGLLLLGSLVWLMLFYWLGERLLSTQGLLSDQGNQVLALLCVVLGVVLVLGWILMLPRWRAWIANRTQADQWPALNQEQIQALSPSEFEAYVAYRLFRRQGYTVENTPDIKDGGVDILIADPIGRQSVVQCKRYNSTVGSAVVRELYGTMIHAGAVRSYLVTSGKISKDARDWAEDKPMTLIDGERLVELSKAEPMLAVMSPPADTQSYSASRNEDWAIEDPLKTGPLKTGPLKTGPLKTGPLKTGNARTGKTKSGKTRIG